MVCWVRTSWVVIALMVQVTPLRAAEVLRVGFPSLATGFAPSWVTADKNIWKKHGLDVELIYLRGGARTVSALIGGSVDFILGSDLGVTTAIVQGASLTRVGVTTNTLGYSMVTQPSIRTVRDLKGKIIGVTPGRDAAYARVVKLLRDSGDQFARWLEGLTDAFLGEQVVLPQGAQPPSKSRFEMLLSAKEHEMHHRAQLMTLQRMLGIVPHLTREREAMFAAMQAGKN